MAEWVPFEKQQRFIELPFSIIEAFYGGTVGTGKSDLLLKLPLLYKFHEHPLFKGILLRRTLADLDKEIIPRAKRLYGVDGKNGRAKYNETKYRFTWPSGAMYFLGHCEHDDDIENYDGVEYNLISFDEIQHHNERPYLYLAFTRRRSASPDLPAIIRNSGMPGGQGHSWTKKRYVDPAPDGFKILYDRKSNTKRIWIKAEPGDNPHLLINTPNYYNELNALPEADRRAKLGDWNAFQGQVFSMYREKPNSDEPSHACHVIDNNVEIYPSWPTIVIGDIGTTALTYFLWMTITPNGQVVCTDEYAVNGGREKYPSLPQDVDIAIWAAEVGQRCCNRNIIHCDLDSTAFESRPERVTIAELFERYSGIRPTAADKGPNSRIQGRILVQEFLRWKDKPSFWTAPTLPFDFEIGQRILRLNGFEAYQRYVDSFSPPKKEILPKLLIKERCKLLREVIPICVYDSTNVEDIAEFHGDDPIDTLRYGCRRIDFYLESHKKSTAASEDKITNTVKDAHIAHMMIQKLRDNKVKGVRRNARRI